MSPRSIVVAGVVIVALLTGAAQAAAGDFDRLVRKIESRYAVRPQGFAVGWLAQMVLKIAKPEGVLDVKLATLQGSGAIRLASHDDLADAIRESLGAEWRPMVMARSRREGTMVSIHARSAGSKYSLFIVSLDAEEGAIIEVSLEPHRFLQWIVDPLNTARRSPA